MSSPYRWQTMSSLAQDKVVAIVRAGDADAARRRCATLLEAGVRVLEVSLTTPGALGVIEELASDSGSAVIGAGTVLDRETVRHVSLSGGTFVVAPTLNDGVIRAAHRYGLCAFPGVGSATEALAALEAGADAVKLFPANAYGVAGMAAIREALPQLPFVPTGGVDLAEGPDWIRAGAVALGLGGGLAALAERGPAAVSEFLANLTA